MEPPARLALVDLAVAFAQIGLNSVGGAAAPLRAVIVKQRKWLDEAEFAEIFGMCQALPGATGANMAVILGRRSGLLGSVVAVAALVTPSMLLAIAIAAFATHVAAHSARFAAGETAVAAGAAGLFIANGARLAWALWRAVGEGDRVYRAIRLAVIAAGVVLVVGFRLWIPAAVVVLVAASLLADRRTGAPK
jgi:chromate transporter